MIKIGVLAGGGKLPFLIGKNLLEKKYEVVFFCLENYANLNLYLKYNFVSLPLNSLSLIIQELKIHKINKIIMVGKVTRPSIKDIKFDINTVRVIKKLLLESSGDDKLLSIISNIFAEKGYPTFNWINECKDLFAEKEFLTKKKPSKYAYLNMEKGTHIFKTIGKSDIAQSLIIQNKLILGIEAIEGTDELIKRCHYYKKKGDEGILIKLSKYNQNPYLDIPTIGLETIKNIKKYNYEGIFLERNKCIILDKKKVIDFCNINNLFISTIIKN